MNHELPINAEDCDIRLSGDLDPGRSIVIVPKSHDGALSERQLVDYRAQRKQFLSWLLNMGKNPKRAEGYAEYTVYSDSYRTAKFDLWVWKRNSEYKYPPDQQDVTAYMKHLAFNDEMSRVPKGKLQEGIQHLSKYLYHQHGIDKWEFDYEFPSSSGNLEPRDYLSEDERRAIRQAALNEGNIPAFDSLTVDERKGWKHHIGDILGLEYGEVGEEHWDQVDGWEITSLVWASLDAGFRPDEVSNAKPSWVDTKNGVLRIPHEDSSKNDGNWKVSITDRTATAMERWLNEREQLDRYDGSDLLWLTSHGNPYGSKALARLLRRLCDKADIDYEDRQMSWYTIRHSVGTYMAHHRDLKAAKDQLRHKSPKTTMQYDQVSVEDRRDVLDQMG